MIKRPTPLNFPDYAICGRWEVNLADMDTKTITATVKFDGDTTPDFSYDWEVEYNGEKYIMPLRKPQGSIEETSRMASVDLTFEHWGIYQLKRYFFCTFTESETGILTPDKYDASVSLTLGDFVNYCAKCLKYYYGDSITIELNPEWAYKKEPTNITIQNSRIWEVLTQLYELYGVKWSIGASSANSDKYVISVGYPTEELDHIFEYGFDGGLLKLERQVQSEDIVNIAIGRGGTDNLPKYYYKEIPDDEKEFYYQDPDWIPELSNIYFDRLRGATFRSYIQGWKTKHYPTNYSAPRKNAYSKWAWDKGYSDAVFAPIEYVADEIADEKSSSTEEIAIMPNHTANVVIGSSISEYGPFFGAIEDNDYIYPSIQGTGMDIAIDIEQITSDEPAEDPTDVTITELGDYSIDVIVSAQDVRTYTTGGMQFNVPEGRTANLLIGSVSMQTSDTTIVVQDYRIKLKKIGGTDFIAPVGIPTGQYTFYVEVDVYNTAVAEDENNPQSDTILIEGIRTQDAILNEYGNGTFNIWVKNIWGSAKKSAESNFQYSERVWKSVLGDRLGDTAKVVFTTGALAVSEDYEFTIVEYPTYDTSKTLNGESSHWRIRLAKSDADYESLGLYVPNSQRNGKAGDKFIFIGTEMTHWYTTQAEIRLDDQKIDALKKVSNIKPTFVVTTDRVRLNGYGSDDAIIHKIKLGDTVRLRDKRFIDASGEEILYIKSLKYTFREPTDNDVALNPDLEITFGDDYDSSSNTIETISGEIDAIRYQLGTSLSNLEKVVRNIGDKHYIRKDKGDKTNYELGVGGKLISASGVRSEQYADGATGLGFDITKEGDITANSLRLRKFLEVPELRFNRTEVVCGTQWRAPGGGLIEYAAHPDGATYGTAYLKLEDGEIGAIAVDDLCMGVYHFGSSSDALADSDDGKGGFKFAGFTTVYFKVTSVASDRKSFTYELRSGYNIHPCAQMNFVAFGNITNTDRQKSYYATRSYGRYLANVNDWVFTESNIMMQTGDLSNLTIKGEQLGGYSAYLNNVFFSGVIRQLDTQLSGYTDNLINGSQTFSLSYWKRYGSNFGERYQNMVVAHLGSSSQADDYAEIASCNYSFEQNETYTLSFWAKGSGIMRSFCYTTKANAFRTQIIATNGKYGAGHEAENAENEYNLTEDWKQFYFVFKVVKNTTINHSILFRSINKANVYLAAVKLEEGDNRKPEWSPSITDLKGDKGDKGDQGEQGDKGDKGDKGENGADGKDGANFEFNLLNGTFDFSGSNWALSSDIITAGKYQQCTVKRLNEDLSLSGNAERNAIFYNALSLEADTDYTLSFWARGNGNLRTFIFSDVSSKVYYPQESSRSDTYGQHALTGTWQRYRVNFHTLNQTISGKQILFRAIGTMYFEIAGIKLEQSLAENTTWAYGSTEIKGSDGKTGPSGAITRVRGLWTADETYSDGLTADENGTRWLDVVWVESATGVRYYYQCIKAEGAGLAANAPKASSSGGNSYWAAMSDLGSVYADLVFAKNARIDFISGQEIVFGDSGGDYWGRIGAPIGDYIMWLGELTADRSTFLLDKYGNARFGADGGSKIEIDTSNSEVRVYDSTNRLAVTIDGKTHSIPADQGLTQNMNVAKLDNSIYIEPSEAKQTKTQTLNSGNMVLSAGGGSLTVSCAVKLTARSYGTTADTRANGTAQADFTLWYKDSVTSNSPVVVDTTSLKIQSSAIPAGGDYDKTLEQTVTLSVDNMDKGVYFVTIDQTVSHTIVGSYRGYAGVLTYNSFQNYVPKLNYESFLGANGLIVAASSLDYLRVGKLNDDENFSIEISARNTLAAQSGDPISYGLRVSKEGVQAKDGSGNWHTLDLSSLYAD